LMPLWAWIVIGVGAVALIAGLVAVGIVAARAHERRTAMNLVARREGVDFVRQALADTLGRLAEGTDDELRAFAYDPDSLERRALVEVASRSALLAEEIDATALPKAHLRAAVALGDAAYLIARESAKVQPGMRGEITFEALGTIDLEAVETYYQAALAAVADVCESCGLEDENVYGGGLYL
jgi:hypothetical protein